MNKLPKQRDEREKQTNPVHCLLAHIVATLRIDPDYVPKGVLPCLAFLQQTGAGCQIGLLLVTNGKNSNLAPIEAANMKQLYRC